MWSVETEGYELCNFIPIFNLVMRRVRVYCLFAKFSFSILV